MFFEERDPQEIVFRRDWGADQVFPIRKLEVALDAITPSNDDCTMRIIYLEYGDYAVSIAAYSNIYFAPPIKWTQHVSLSKEVFAELLEKKFILPFSFFTAPSVDSTLWVVSDEGEAAWRAAISN